MNKLPKNRSKHRKDTPLTPEMRECFDEIVRMIENTRSRIRAILDSDPNLLDLFNGEAGPKGETVNKSRKKSKGRKPITAKQKTPRKRKRA
jgi:hypothetical protein